MAAAGINWIPAQTFTRSEADYVEAVKLCLERGAPVNATNSLGACRDPRRGQPRVGVGDSDPRRPRREARREGRGGRTPMTFAEGIFLAIRPPVAKPEAMALLKKLMANESHPVSRMLRSHSSRPAWASSPVSRTRSPVRASDRRTPSPGSRHRSQPLLDQYCVTCHNERLKTGGLALDTLSSIASSRRRDLGESRPQGARGPDAAGRRQAARSRDARRVCRCHRRHASIAPPPPSRIPAARRCTA